MNQKKRHEAYAKGIALIEQANKEMEEERLAQEAENQLNPSQWNRLNLFKTLWAIWKGEKDWKGQLLGLYNKPPKTRKPNARTNWISTRSNK